VISFERMESRDRVELPFTTLRAGRSPLSAPGHPGGNDACDGMTQEPAHGAVNHMLPARGRDAETPEPEARRPRRSAEACALAIGRLGKARVFA